MPAPGAPHAALRELIILGGAVRPSALSARIGRSLLDLPLNERESLLDRWVGELDTLAAIRAIPPLSLRVMLDAASTLPAVPQATAGTGVHQQRVIAERDPFEFRGTGGVLHDAARALDDGDYLLVVSGAQLLTEPLHELVDLLVRRGGDVGIVAHRDGTPSGLMLIRCGVLRGIPDLGFVDLKEQALPAIAKSFRVMVEYRDRASLSVRTAQDYLAALRHDHRRRRGETVSNDPFAEDWRSEFAVAEEGAQVAAPARLFDSVVLRGGSVGEGATLVRSIVSAGGTVKAGERVGDQMIAPPERGAEKARGGR